MLNELQRSAYSPHGRPMCLYGDPAYPLRVHLQAPFRNALLPPPMQAFNTSISIVRELVEWLFNDIVSYFKFVDFKKNLKIGCAQYLETHLLVCMVTKLRVILSWNPRLSKIISRNPRPSFVAFSRTDLKTTVKKVEQSLSQATLTLFGRKLKLNKNISAYIHFALKSDRVRSYHCRTSQFHPV